MSHPNKVYDVCPYCLEEVRQKAGLDYCTFCELVTEGTTLHMTADELEWSYELDSETEA